MLKIITPTSKPAIVEWEIKPETTWLGSSLKELFLYKDLLLRMVRKDFLSSYQQTLLGPLWIIINPLLTVLTYVLIFSRVLSLSTEGIPAFVFYLSGITLWNLFSELLLGTSYVFSQNIDIFSKVYFPRLIAPLSTLLLNLYRFGIQFIIFLIVLIYTYSSGQAVFNIRYVFLAIPIVIITAGMGFGAGLIFSVITIKYKDVLNLLNVLVRLLMFVCPIFFTLSAIPEKIKWFAKINPLSSLFEIFRFAFFGVGHIGIFSFLYSLLCMFFLMITGILLFNKWGDKLIDII